MKLFALLVPLLVFSGCVAEVETTVGDDDVADDDDSVADDDTEPGTLAVTAGSWRLHAEIESMAYVSWEQSAAAPAWVEFNFDDDEWVASPRFDAAAGAHEQILLGIPFGTEVQWRVVAEEGAEQVVADGETFTTGPYPVGLPFGSIEASEPDAWEPTGSYLLSSICEETGSWNPGNYWTFIVDRQGRPVWASVAPNQHWTLFAQVSVDGTYILWDESTYWLDWGANMGIGSTVHKQYLDAEIEVLPTDGIVHAFVELPDGTLAWGSEYHVPHTEALVELAPGADEVDIIWTCQDDYPGSPGAYCASNGMFYEESTDSYLYSFWDESVVIEVDRATGDNLWWAGGVQGGYSFDPQESRFSFQHGISYTDEGTLLVHTSGTGMGSGLEAREYEVDHTTETLHELWSFGLGAGGSMALNGDVWRLPGGNTLHTLGSEGVVIEITPDEEVVWHLDYQAEHLMGRSGLIDDLYDLVPPPE